MNHALGVRIGRQVDEVANSLVGKTLRAVHVFSQVTVPAAWVNELTTRVAVTVAILEFADGELARVTPCEVQVDAAKYPALGLSFEFCSGDALTMQTGSGTNIAGRLPLVDGVLPLATKKVECSDPLEEGAVSEVRLVGEKQTIVFRHIMPPMTLGVDFWEGESAVVDSSRRA